jgi:hypothetical protein
MGQRRELAEISARHAAGRYPPDPAEHHPGPDILRDRKSLKTIAIEWNQAWPAAEFWERYDKGEFKE